MFISTFSSKVNMNYLCFESFIPKSIKPANVRGALSYKVFFLRIAKGLHSL